nr:immunoglobulin light chain junction region [Macaca mulatta]
CQQYNSAPALTF